MYSDSEFPVHRRLEPSEPCRTQTFSRMLELCFVLDDGYTQLNRLGVFLFGVGERGGRNDGWVQKRTLTELAMENSRGRMSGKRSKMYSFGTFACRKSSNTSSIVLRGR